MSDWKETQNAAARVEFVAIRSAAEQVTCPECQAEPRHTCQNLIGPGPVRFIPAHDKRIKKARG